MVHSSVSPPVFAFVSCLLACLPPFLWSHALDSWCPILKPTAKGWECVGTCLILLCLPFKAGVTVCRLGQTQLMFHPSLLPFSITSSPCISFGSLQCLPVSFFPFPFWHHQCLLVGASMPICLFVGVPPASCCSLGFINLFQLCDCVCVLFHLVRFSSWIYTSPLPEHSSDLHTLSMSFFSHISFVHFPLPLSVGEGMEGIFPVSLSLLSSCKSALLLRCAFLSYPKTCFWKVAGGSPGLCPCAGCFFPPHGIFSPRSVSPPPHTHPSL